jgi:hypothetical protein
LGNVMLMRSISSESKAGSTSATAQTTPCIPFSSEDQ